MVFAFIRAILGEQKEGIAPQMNMQKKKEKGHFIDTSHAVRIELPYMKTPQDDRQYEERDRSYWTAYNKGVSHYGRGWYKKAKAEFLKIYDDNPDATYYTHLIRTYRKLFAKLKEKKKLTEAFAVLEELLEKCPNYTNTDVKVHNKLVDELALDRQKKELVTKEKEPAFTIHHKAYIAAGEGKKPKGFKVQYEYAEISPYRLERMRQTLWPPLPHVRLTEDGAEYVGHQDYPHPKGIAYRMRSVSGNNEQFIYSTADEMEIRLSDWSLNSTYRFDGNRYSGDKYHLRCVDMAADLSGFLFTVIDDCYLLDSNFRLVNTWKVPYKIDIQDPRYERRSRSDQSAEQSSDVHDALRTLNISNDRPTTQDVKLAYRQLSKQWHPDKNQGDQIAEQKFKEINNAYECIMESGLETVSREELAEDEYWVKVTSRESFTVQGFTFEVQMGMSVDPSDWIYGSGMSDDGSRIYLGCYSGKTYEISQDGVASAIYVITNNQSADVIREDGDYLHILTHSHLYIIDRAQKKYLHAIPIENAKTIRFFSGGFIHIERHDVIMYNSRGEEMERLTFRSVPKYVFRTPEEKIIVETGKQLYLFQAKKGSQ